MTMIAMGCLLHADKHGVCRIGEDQCLTLNFEKQTPDDPAFLLKTLSRVTEPGIGIRNHEDLIKHAGDDLSIAGMFQAINKTVLILEDYQLDLSEAQESLESYEEGSRNTHERDLARLCLDHVNKHGSMRLSSNPSSGRFVRLQKDHDGHKADYVLEEADHGRSRKTPIRGIDDLIEAGSAYLTNDMVFTNYGNAKTAFRNTRMKIVELEKRLDVQKSRERNSVFSKSEPKQGGKDELEH